jgi:pyruvate kinase
MNYSRAQIIATIGPASKEKEVIKNMIAHQMDLARLNFSWGTYEEHTEFIKNIRESSKESGKRIPIIQDLSGPRIQRGGSHEINPEAEEIITKKDLADLEFGIKQNLDYIAMSYVGNKNDVVKLKNHIKRLGGKIPVIAKIERQSALDDLENIIDASDVIMVARGDLGNEIPLEKIPFVQKDIIRKCKDAVKPVITATQMMLSMVENPYPTRAEVTDVAFAILIGSDAVMLSEESARGKYPVEAVSMMEKIVLESENQIVNFYLNPLK